MRKIDEIENSIIESKKIGSAVSANIDEIRKNESKLFVEDMFKDYTNLIFETFPWLINRVRKLEKGLELIRDGGCTIELNQCPACLALDLLREDS